MDIGDQCQQCFDQYCWDGSINTTVNAYNPVLRSDNSTFITDGQGAQKSGGDRSIHIPSLVSVLAVSVASFLA
jgi:hypothetical protein